MGEARNSPVLLIAYRRPQHTQRVLQSLLANPLAASSDVLVHIDGPANVAEEAAISEVAQVCRATRGFASISVERSERHLGLAQSVVSAVTTALVTHETIIVLEDDIVVSSMFLDYMNDALRLYADDDKVASISAYNYPINGELPATFFVRGADCWGWATWRRGWGHFRLDGADLLDELTNRNLLRTFDFDGSARYSDMLRSHIRGENDSWAVRWYASAFLDDLVTLYPRRSLVHNIGLDGSGFHGSTDAEQYDSGLAQERVAVEWQEPGESAAGRAAFEAYFRSIHGPVWLNRIKGIGRSLLSRQ